MGAGAAEAACASPLLQAVQVSVLVALFCWGLPATAREMCSDTYNTFDGNLQQLTLTLTP